MEKQVDAPEILPLDGRLDATTKMKNKEIIRVNPWNLWWVIINKNKSIMKGIFYIEKLGEPMEVQSQKVEGGK